jgi:hypothetical protein
VVCRAFLDSYSLSAVPGVGLGIVGLLGQPLREGNRFVGESWRRSALGVMVAQGLNSVRA